MKLESAAIRGRDVLGLEPEIRNGVLNTTNVVRAVFEEEDGFSTADLACSTQLYLARGLAQLALQAANSEGVRAIGFSGGVAYNKHMATTIRKSVAANGSHFYTHEAFPAGDGGVSFGQALAGAFWARNRNSFMRDRDFGS
jgi:hydrogenase maturation protein HypF